MMTQTLYQIIADAWEFWDRTHQRHPTLVPKESAPILWFGDEQRYQKSLVKIVTVGVNPGPLAFPKYQPWRNYPKLKDDATRRDPIIYQEAMNEFPFDGWFKPFNPLLAPFCAGYAVSNTHEALHLDLCPIMTTVLWSKLPLAIRDELAKEGVSLLQRLLEYLEPHWVFFSVSRYNFNRYLHQQLSLRLPAQVSCLQSSSGARHEVREVTQTGAQVRMFWFRKRGIRPISPAGASLRAFGEHLINPHAPNPLVSCGQASSVSAPQPTPTRTPRSRATTDMTSKTFTKAVREEIEAEVSTFRYSHNVGKYSFYRLNLMDDEPVLLKSVIGRRSFVNLVFELDQKHVGKAFLEITPHFIEGWRAQASQEFLKCQILNIKRDAKYIRLINFNRLLGVPITNTTQIKNWVLNIEEQLEAMLSVDTHAPSMRWSYMNNQLHDQWHHLSQLLPIQQ